MTFKRSLLVIAISTSLLSACTTQMTGSSSINSTELTTTQIANASAQANNLFDAIFKEGIDRDPVKQTYLGIKKDYDKWNDLTEEHAIAELKFAKANLLRIQAIDINALDSQTKISYNLYVQKLQNTINDFQWRFHNYPVNQMFGTHSQVPAFLINNHSISNVKEAQDYISRVHGAKKLMVQLVEQLALREAKGIVAPKFVFAHVIRDSKNILVGAPFDSTADSTILADFTAKVNKLDINNNERSQLIKDVSNALVTSLKPGYESLIRYLTLLETKADTREGVWKFPRGEEFYNNALKRTTTTDLTSDQIHQLGLDEVARIHNEMRVIMKKVGFKGNLKEFFCLYARR